MLTVFGQSKFKKMTGSGGAAFTTLMSMMSVPTRSLRRVAVFSGHLCGNNPAYAQAAAALGEELAKRKIAVICGGHLHTTGLAKAVADSALEHGGNIITVIDAPTKECISSSLHGYVITTPDFHSRKEVIYHLSDAIIFLPGALESLDGLAESICWNQLGCHAKPVGVVNVLGFYDGYFKQVEHGVNTGFIHPKYGNIHVSSQDINEVLDGLCQKQLPPSVVTGWSPFPVAEAAEREVVEWEQKLTESLQVSSESSSASV